jgi:CTP synthase (UTP-ammonia lyase)
MRASVRVGLIGDYDPDVVAHRAIPVALRLASTAADIEIEPTWIRTDALPADVAPRLAVFDGVWCVPGSPYVNTAGALNAIRFAREAACPFLGTCGGFQHALIEYARNVIGIAEADHAESNPGASVPIIASLRCSLVGETGSVRLTPGSRAYALYGDDEAIEEYHCSYGLNPEYVQLFTTGLRFTGHDEQGDPRVVELPLSDHPFYLATLFQPERAALHGAAHPIIIGFVRAMASHHAAAAKSATN